jgi:hypothetical protein
VAKWTADHWRVEITNTGSQSKLSYVMLDERAPSRVRWPHACYACTLDDAGNLTDAKGTVVATVYQGRAEDADGAEVGVKTLFDREAVEYQVDAGKAAWPVTLDPTVDYTVGADSDDGWEFENSSQCSYSGNYFGIIADSSASVRMRGAARFSAVIVAQGSTIDVAYVSVRPSNLAANDDVLCHIYCQAADNAATIVATAHNIMDRARTSNNVAWAVDNLGTGAYVNTPSIVSPVQDVISRAGFSSGNAVMVLFCPDSTASKTMGPTDYHAWGAARAPKLHIEYTAASTGFKHYLGLLGVGR